MAKKKGLVLTNHDKKHESKVSKVTLEMVYEQNIEILKLLEDKKV